MLQSELTRKEKLHQNYLKRYVKKGWNAMSGLFTRFKKGDGHFRWKGGVEATYERYARRVMELNLGRKLKKGEVVHHLDHNWKNNDIDNLYLFSNQSKHSTYHKLKESWISEILCNGV